MVGCLKPCKWRQPLVPVIGGAANGTPDLIMLPVRSGVLLCVVKATIGNFGEGVVLSSSKASSPQIHPPYLSPDPSRRFSKGSGLCFLGRRRAGNFDPQSDLFSRRHPRSSLSRRLSKSPHPFSADGRGSP